jgi:hypothetical protein
MLNVPSKVEGLKASPAGAEKGVLKKVCGLKASGGA